MDTIMQLLQEDMRNGTFPELDVRLQPYVKTEGTPARKKYRMDAGDCTICPQQIGLAGARAAAAHVARGQGSTVDAHHGGSRPPATAAPVMMADENAGHVGDVAEAHRARRS